MSEILMVDDNPANLDLLGKLLRERSHKVRAATSGRKARLHGLAAPYLPAGAPLGANA